MSNMLELSSPRAASSSPDDVLARACREPLPVHRDHTFGLPREYRVRPRLRFDCPIRWSCGGVDRFGIARDASEIGAGFTVRSLSQPQVGQEIRLVFELDDDHEWIVDEKAVVARCDPRPDGLCDVGVRLRKLDV
jgi:hypothetical protein